MKHSVKRFLSAFLCALLLIGCCPALFSVTSLAADAEPLKKRGTFYTDEEMKNLAENMEKYDWVRSTAASAQTNADKYLKQYSLEELWELLPSQKVFRSYAVNQPLGCLNCGLAIDKYGNYPYTHNHMTDPWKIVCPNCGMKFPTNDFGAYYKSGLDANGLFQPSKADKSLLKNTLYPEKGEKWGVDDGTGYLHTNGEKYFFVAYYTHWALWYSSGIITASLNAFANAYLYSGEQKYADAAIVMLCRLGDLYPSFNIKDCPWSAGYRHSGRNNGVIIGSIWETGLVDNFLVDYDAVFRGFPTMSKEALEVLQKHNSKIKSYKDVMINIENGFVKRIFEEVKAGNIRGNNGMHQYSLSLAAVVLDDKTLSKQWLDYVFSSSGLKVSSTFVTDVDQDGWGNEASPGYNSGWLSNYMSMANLLQGYKVAGTGDSYDLYNNIKFKKMFAAGIEIIATPKFSPNIGDTGSTGSAGINSSTSYLIHAYRVYGDPLYAQLIWFLTGGNVAGIRLTAFDKDPESFPEKITADVKEHGEYKLTSRMLTGYGLATCMNINSASKAASNEETSQDFLVGDISVINAKTLKGFVRDETKITFTPEKAGDTISVGAYLKTSAAIYEYIVFSAGISGGGKFDVFVDGKLLQDAVSFDTKAGTRTPVYFRKTFELDTGYHVISFRAAESKVGPMAVEGFKFMKQAAAVSNGYHNPQTTMTMYFGRNTGHGHYDTLNLGLYAFDMDLSPDLGYPEFCDGTPNQVYWVENTVSHNTVIVNDSHMGSQIVSQPRAFDSNDFVSLVSVNADTVYPTTDKYRRTAALIKYDDEYSYVVDFFAVSGGKKHTYSFHPAQSSALQTTGLNFVKQADANGNFIGTLAGPTVAWGGQPLSSGYQYLDKVQRDANPESTISFDWSIVDYRNQTSAENMHLKLTMITDLDEVVLANGTPPRNKAGNPAGLDYVLASRTSKTNKLRSLFVSAMEPYIGEGYILSFEAVDATTTAGKVTDDSVKAVKVTLKNGRIDYVVYSEEPNATYTIDKKFYFRGFFGILSIRGDEVLTYTNDAVMDVIEDKTSYSGTVVDFTKELTDKNFIKVKFAEENIDTKQLTGNYIYIANDGVRNACYRILGVEKQDDAYVLDIGDITTIRQYKNIADTSGGFVFNVGTNKRFTIPLRTLTGDLDVMLASVKTSVRDITLSNNIKKDAKAGDRVAYIYVLNDTIDYLYQLPEYELSLIEDSFDSAMFEIRDGWLYLKSDLIADKTEYNVSIKVTDKATGASQAIMKTLSTLSKSQSASQQYPDFEMSETEETAEFVAAPADDPSGDDKDTESAPINWLAIAITAVIAAAVVGVTSVLTGKKKKA